MSERMKVWLAHTNQKWHRLNGKAREKAIVECVLYDMGNPHIAF